ncbi:MAG: ferritin-like domain-containing protein [Actinomycetota bacterium]|nr:ferritin-like domain-containing protein [Actinomycetota bacterium]
MTMHDHRPTFSELDRDGALEEAASRVDGHTRAAFFAKTGAIIGGAAFFTAFPSSALAQDTPKSDVDILNYALTLEFLEAAFYKTALDQGALSGDDLRFAKVVEAHEQAHVDALKKTLGAKATKRPSFDFKGTTDAPATFRSTAMTLEDAGVAAYQGQATNIKTKAVAQAAVSILPVEARHAAWIRSVIGKGSGEPSPAPDAFNPAQSMSQILAAVGATGFISEMGATPSASPVSGTPSVAG